MNELEETLVTLRVAQKAHNAGFGPNVYTSWYYDTRNGELFLDSEILYGEEEHYINAPSQGLLQKWLIKEKGCGAYAIPTFDGKLFSVMYQLPGQGISKFDDLYDTYEIALNVGLVTVLKHLIEEV